MVQMVKAIIFDCFGVILTDALQVVHDELKQQNPEAAEELRGLIQAANRGLIDPAESSAQAAKLLGLSVDAYRQKITQGEVRNTPLLDYIPSLRANYKTALLSNITVQGIERRFPDNELDRYFDEIVISSDIGFAKPDKEAYEITAQRLGVSPEECIFTDDRLDFCTAAETVGMRAIEFKSFEQFTAQLNELLTA
jgi:HAD superfamily hydrolase (TIGR01509 family)